MRRLHVPTCPTLPTPLTSSLLTEDEWRQTVLQINYSAGVRRRGEEGGRRGEFRDELEKNTREKESDGGGGFFAIWPADSGLDCAAGKRRHKRNRGSPLNPGGGAVTPEQGNTGALIYLLRCFIRTPLTAAGPFVLLILAIKHACRGRGRIGREGGGLLL